MAAISDYGTVAAQTPELSPALAANLANSMEDWLADRPLSTLAAGLRADLGLYYRLTGHYSKALEHWRAAWAECAPAADGNGKLVADRVLPQLASLLASLGRVEELELLFASQHGRLFTESDSVQLWMRTREAYAQMVRKPWLAYRCGPLALFNASAAAGNRAAGQLLRHPSPATGFSLAELEQLARKHQLGFVAAHRSEGAAVVVPSVVHWREDHYAAVVAEKDGDFLVEDPTFGNPLWMSGTTLAAEASGYFLIPASVGLPRGWRGLVGGEAERVFGRGYPSAMDDESGPECCEPGLGGAGTGSGEEECGMATWKVHEPNINLEVRDVPLRYQAAYGPDFVLGLTWRQRFTTPMGSRSHYTGDWHCDLLSWVDGYPAAFSGTNAARFKLHWGNGFRYPIEFPAGSLVSETNYFNGLWAERTVLNGIVTQLEVAFRNGARERYQLATTYEYRLVWRKDATQQALTFDYNEPNAPQNRLHFVETADGARFHFQHNDPDDPYQITSVTGPDNRVVTFQYGLNGYIPVLASITDVAGLTSSFGYDAYSGWIVEMTTPYGVTQFNPFDAGACFAYPLDCPGVDRAVTVGEPDGSRQVYLFYDNSGPIYGQPSEFAGIIPGAFSPTQIPVYGGADDPPVQTLDTVRDQRNSHHWNRQQAAALSTTNLFGLNATDFRLSRTAHWLGKSDPTHSLALSLRTLSWTLPPSPDGLTEALPTFYDYAGKDTSTGASNGVTGASSLPSVIARRMPDGTTHYRFFERNPHGMKSNEIERWVENGQVRFRTNSFRYATGTGNVSIDDLLLVEHKGPSGELIFGYGLHPSYPDQIRFMTNAVGEVTTLDYDAYRRVISRQTTAGLLSSHTYDPSTKRLASVVDSIAGSPVRTNSYTWLNGFQRTHTDPCGLTRTFTYDLRGRLTQTAYPDGTSETWNYQMPPNTGFNTAGSWLPILDRVTYKDRLNHYWQSIPNRLRQTEKLVEPSKTTPGGLGTEITLTYCGCGSPTAAVLASNTGSPETTAFEYDYQGNLIRLTLPDNTSVTNRYDLLGRLQVREDALMKLTNTYDNLDRVIARRHGGGLVEGFGYDWRDRVLASTNAAGVWATNQYDPLGRLLVRGQPDGGKEYWSYTLGQAEATRYTNQVGKITTWAYDAAQRRTNEIQVGVYTNSFFYTPGDDLKELRDGKNQKTTWTYDLYGRVAYKFDHLGTNVLAYLYDANSRLTNRWSKAKGNTAYKYDAVGSLTNVDYPAGTTDLTFRYDPFNRLTNMVDAAGTTKFKYRPGGLLLSEEAPWASSLLTNAYSAAGVRTNLSLQQPTSFWTSRFTYDSARRLQSAVSPAGTFTYTYKGAGSLWTNLALPNTARITNAFDSVGRLLGTYLRTSAGAISNKHEYVYTTAHQRTRHTRSDNSHLTFSYDNLSQLTVVRATTSAGVLISGETKGYLYDAAQNLNVRTNSSSGGTTSFVVNSLNQLTSGPYGSATYDWNGNLITDNSHTYTYDAENQLTQVLWGGGTFRTDLLYDGLGRLRKRSESFYSGGWSLLSETRYLYDGRRVIQERNGSNTPTVSYTRGNDLSGSLEGAGGIGGLLARSHGYSGGSWSTHHCYHADGGGNITYLMSSSQGLSARYTYDAYGNTVSSSGSLASANGYRFSSKEWVYDGAGGYYYYGYRCYSPNLQRWLNRDPLGEAGGINLYGYVANSPLGSVDPFGLNDYS